MLAFRIGLSKRANRLRNSSSKLHWTGGKNWFKTFARIQKSLTGRAASDFWKNSHTRVNTQPSTVIRIRTKKAGGEDTRTITTHTHTWGRR